MLVARGGPAHRRATVGMERRTVMRRRLWAALVFGMMAAFAQPAGAQDWNTKVTLDAPAGTSVTVTLTTGNVTLNAGGFTYIPATH